MAAWTANDAPAAANIFTITAAGGGDLHTRLKSSDKTHAEHVDPHEACARDLRVKVCAP
jgi:hypothetical protein